MPARKSAAGNSIKQMFVVLGAQKQQPRTDPQSPCSKPHPLLVSRPAVLAASTQQVEPAESETTCSYLLASEARKSGASKQDRPALLPARWRGIHPADAQERIAFRAVDVFEDFPLLGSCFNLHDGPSDGDTAAGDNECVGVEAGRAVRLRNGRAHFALPFVRHVAAA